MTYQRDPDLNPRRPDDPLDPRTANLNRTDPIRDDEGYGYGLPLVLAILALMGIGYYMMQPSTERPRGPAVSERIDRPSTPPPAVQRPATTPTTPTPAPTPAPAPQQ